MNGSSSRVLAAVLTFAALALVAAAPARAALDWNDAGIAWRGLDDGLGEAKRTGRPVCLVVYSQTCPHCRNYSQVFHDSRVVERAKQFVMIRVDQDAGDRNVSRYAPDGGYIPRTLFLSPDGEVQTAIHAPRNKYVHFYDEHNPISLLNGMTKALARWPAGSAAQPPAEAPIVEPTPALLSPGRPPAVPAAAPPATSGSTTPSPAAPSGAAATAEPPRTGEPGGPPEIVRDPSGQLIIRN
ncbi:MAG: thioredoxin family protein [bacterium]